MLCYKNIEILKTNCGYLINLWDLYNLSVAVSDFKNIWYQLLTPVEPAKHISCIFVSNCTTSQVQQVTVISIVNATCTRLSTVLSLSSKAVELSASPSNFGKYIFFNLETTVMSDHDEGLVNDGGNQKGGTSSR